MARSVDTGKRPGPDASTRTGGSSDRRKPWTFFGSDGKPKQVGSNHKGPGGHTPQDVMSA